MTNREFYVAIENGTINEEIINFAHEQLEKMDARNKARSSKPSKTQVENEPIKKAILEFLVGKEKVPAGDIGKALEISTQKASALCRQLESDKLVVSEEVKIPKEGKKKGYTLV